MKAKSIVSFLLLMCITFQILTPFSFAAIQNNPKAISEVKILYEENSVTSFESMWFSDTYRYLFVDNENNNNIVITVYNKHIEILYNDNHSIYKTELRNFNQDLDFNNIEIYRKLKNQVLNGDILLTFFHKLPKETVQPSTRSYSGAFSYYKENVPSEFLDRYVGFSSYNGKTGYVYENMYLSFEDLGAQTYNTTYTLGQLISILGINEPRLRALGFVFKIVHGIQMLAQEYTIVKYRGTQNYVRDVTIDGIIRYEEGKYIRHYVYSGYIYETTQYMNTQDANYDSVYGLVRQAVINIGY